MNFSEKVKFTRGKLYLSQQALANKVGVSFSTINRWENGRSNPNWVQECKFNDFCKRSGISFEEK